MVDLTNVSEKLEKGDTLMICSDGVSDKLSNDEIKALLTGPKSICEKANSLLNKAVQNGSRDNLTVILIEAQN